MVRNATTSAGDMAPRDPAPLRALLCDVRYAPLWLAPRFVLGWISLEAGWRQLQGLPRPIGQLAAGGGFGPGELLAIGLTLSGVALLLGALTGPAAFLAGSLSAGVGAGEPEAALAFAAAVLLVLAWKTAGWIGLDRWLLPMLGLPVRRSPLVGRAPVTRAAATDETWTR